MIVDKETDVKFWQGKYINKFGQEKFNKLPGRFSGNVTWLTEKVGIEPLSPPTKDDKEITFQNIKITIDGELPEKKEFINTPVFLEGKPHVIIGNKYIPYEEAQKIIVVNNLVKAISEYLIKNAT